METMKVIDGLPENYFEIVEGLRTGVVLLDNDDSYYYLNVAARDILGTTNILKKLNNLDFVDVNLQTYINSVRSNNTPVTLRDLKFVNFDKVEKICDCSISTFLSYEQQYILLELNETGRLYNISNEKNLIDQQKATTEMVKGLSHEIKNPLGGIMGAAQLLEKTLSNEAQTKFTEIILKESERLLKLMNAMSSPLRLEDKKLINVHEITEHVIELFKYDSINSSVTFNKDYDPSIPQLMLNRNQIIQALMNIIRNAVQATGYKGTVEIKTRPLQKFTIGDTSHDLVVKVDVIDNGVGIPQDKIKEIFFPMVTSKHEGMGLGLTIAQSIIVQNKGIIECTSQNNKTVFSIILPWITE
tara:strand:+ start:134 stop:1204 length:1071 start_codon:yes stop_codon:yes gene_type:complete